ncbi:hypothetical protein SCLCIDRAFT_1218263 [Scleroderma citrinum Foug A]|uniref:HMA domain-containing protein n=1 Tax=Scleroderma citrinum Foug A TaxID=1036808 RepID=A0A0C3DSC9_9AGAM|nr:hypothetical protein SCLCIDRAFT_1218263 [Scleroderma citrinum Foug A]
MPIYKFNVKMTCGGCSGAVTRALDKFKREEPEKIDSFDVDLDKQLVTVTAKADYGTVLERIKKTGKQVISGEEVVGPA